VTIAMLLLGLISALIIVFERRVYRIIIYFGINSLIISVVYLLLGAPDVAMAEAVTAAFSTVFFIVCLEKYYDGNKTSRPATSPSRGLTFKRFIGVFFPAVLCVAAFVLYIKFLPDAEIATYLKESYLLRFMDEIGGENPVTSIYLAYRVYDTLFEALILVISVVAVVHMSFFEEISLEGRQTSVIKNSRMMTFMMRIICPMIIIFGVYLISNGHLTPGGGFQGGLAVATFFICRYMIHDIYDIPIDLAVRLEEIIFICIVAVAVIVVFAGSFAHIPYAFRSISQSIYLITMNVLIGLKVACGFFVLFYRYIAIERR